jgi:outer membrane biosynthesis protein TonB
MTARRLIVKHYFVLILIASTVLAANQNTQKTETPVDILYGERTVDQRRQGPVHSGVMNIKAKAVELPLYPDKAKEQKIEGDVEVQLLVDEEGEVIFANPQSGPEPLWASSVRAAVNLRFTPTKLRGQPVKIHGRVIYRFRDGKVEMPFRG